MLLKKSTSWSLVLSLLCFLNTLVLATPNLGIQHDPLPEPEDGTKFPKDSYQSYSSIIKFKDGSIPGDKGKLTDGQLINLAKVAYKEMIAIWENNGLLSPDACPGAMAAMESNGHIFFASSVRSLLHYHTLLGIDSGDHNSVGWFMKACLNDGMGVHVTGGKCAEPNVLRLYGDYVKLDSNGNYVAPPKSETSPRFAVWGREYNEDPKTAEGKYFLPCRDSANAWGCIRFKNWYGLKPAQNVVADPGGQDDWQFDIVSNPRALNCPTQ